MKLKNKKRSRFFKRIKQSLEEVLAHRQGKLELKLEHAQHSELREYKPQEIKKIRKERDYSQDDLSRALKVSVRTVRSWETGRAVPSQANAKKLDTVRKRIAAPSARRKR